MNKKCVKTPLMKISLISRVSHKMMRNESEKMGYNQSYRSIIFFLNNIHDGATQAELVEHSKLSKPTISLTLQKMESDGLIVRKQDDVDLRNVRVYLTDLGVKAEETFIKIGNQTELKVLSVLDAEEQEVLDKILDKILDNMKEHGEK